MMTAPFLTNLPALAAERRLASATGGLRQSFERLASGLRINRASDDAAGLAIASTLRADSKVLGQAARNINDAISLHNIAEGGAQELSSVVTRLRELAEQSANGTLTNRQRTALNSEAQALISEYSRILATTEFNGLTLFPNGGLEVDVQAGYGQRGVIELALGDEIDTDISSTIVAGDGTFGGGAAFASVNSPRQMTYGDVNGDGHQDVIVASRYNNRIQVYQGNGDGTLKAPTNLNLPNRGIGVQVGDVDHDGDLDVVATSRYVDELSVFLGTGTGSFGARQVYEMPQGTSQLHLGDFNGDGNLDAVADLDIWVFSLALGNADGSFSVAQQWGPAGRTIDIGDFNNDGRLDVARTGSASGNGLVIELGNGDGTFKASITTPSFANSGQNMRTGDLNGDGFLDVVAASYAGSQDIRVMLGNGTGYFKAAINYTGSSQNAIDLRDLNGDGRLDIVQGTATGVNIFFGNGDGTALAPVSSTLSGSFATSILFVDLNGDGALDVAGGAGAAFGTALSNTIIAQAPIDISTQQGAWSAMSVLADVAQSVEAELAVIGSNQSRLNVAVSNIIQTRENYERSASQILDVDVAEESASLVRQQILQSTASAVLVQANQLPELVLRILNAASG